MKTKTFCQRIREGRGEEADEAADNIESILGDLGIDEIPRAMCDAFFDGLEALTELTVFLIMKLHYHIDFFCAMQNEFQKMHWDSERN